MRKERKLRSSEPRVFISLTGEYQNIGDAVIRRIVLDWVRPKRGVSAYVGRADESWVRLMRLDPEDTVMRRRPLEGPGDTEGIGVGSMARWLFQILLSGGRPVLVTEPGELTLARFSFPRQMVFLLLALAVKARRGLIILPPRAVTRRPEARPWGPTLLLHRWICRLSHTCWWRDEWSLEQIGVGELVPDTAFAGDLREGLADGERKTLFISMRGQRPLPSEAWLEAIQAFAFESGLNIVVGAQVAEDDQRCKDLARLLGGTYLAWDVNGPSHEEVLRKLYDRSRYVIADRLHVLIIASLSGASPLELVGSPSGKISTHFETIGVSGVSLDTEGMDADEICDWLRGAVPRAADVRGSVLEANQDLRARASKIRLITGLDGELSFG